MSDVKSYKDLNVWQKAVDLVPQVYAVVRSLPQVEQYALSDQIRRSVVSIAANIAEGQARQHRKEFLQSLYIARGSLAELETLLIVAEKLGYVKPEDLPSIHESIPEIRRMLQGLINSLAR
jgi:four helix bundle protein